MSGSDVLESAIIAITGCFLSIVLLRFLGEILDRLVEGLISVGMYEVGTAWQSGNTESLMNIFYIACMSPAVLSIVVAFLRTQKKTERDMGQFATEPEEFAY